ncbi:MAG: hypothetical protein JW738_00100 [Actinobacteria bacterium]|nr:hypothetical protein [Actinomycetota bacterium]
MTCDYRYWKEKGLLGERKYYIDIRLTVVQRVASVFIALFFKVTMKKGLSNLK